MNIRIKDDNLGECIINSYVNVDEDTQYLIKALSAFILLCMNSNENPKKHEKLAVILKEAANKANDIFSADAKEEVFDATESFF
jgi:hypothetical protein